MKINFATLTNLKELDISSPGKYPSVELNWNKPISYVTSEVLEALQNVPIAKEYLSPVGENFIVVDMHRIYDVVEKTWYRFMTRPCSSCAKRLSR